MLSSWRPAPRCPRTRSRPPTAPTTGKRSSDSAGARSVRPAPAPGDEHRATTRRAGARGEPGGLPSWSRAQGSLASTRRGSIRIYMRGAVCSCHESGHHRGVGLSRCGASAAARPHPDLEVVTAQADTSAGMAIADLFPGIGGAYAGLTTTPTDPGAARDATSSSSPCRRGDHRWSCRRSWRWSGWSSTSAPTSDSAIHGLPRAGTGSATTAPELLGAPCCGLPELHRTELAGARLIAAPGLLRDRRHPRAAASPRGRRDRAGRADRRRSERDLGCRARAVGDDPPRHGERELRRLRVARPPSHPGDRARQSAAQVLFTPHLAPMTRGILATCYRAARPAGHDRRRCSRLLAARYAGEPFVEVVGVPALDPRDLRLERGAADAPASDARTGHVLVLARDRQPHQGRRRAGDAGGERRARPRRDRGLPRVGGDAVSVTGPKGFVANGVAAGIKPGGLADLALVVAGAGAVPRRRPSRPTSRCAAPVVVSRRASRGDRGSGRRGRLEQRLCQRRDRSRRTRGRRAHGRRRGRRARRPASRRCSSARRV